MAHIVQVKVTTFKDSGKYYDEWVQELTVEKNEWYYIINAMKEYKPTHPVQTSMDWLIGMDNSRNDMYPIILKG